MSSELKTVSAKITEVCKLEKSAWNNIDGVETKVKKLNTEVDLVEEKQIQEIQKKSAENKTSFNQYLDKVIDEVENQTTELMLKKESWLSLWRSKYSDTNQSDLILIARQKENMALLKEASGTSLDLPNREYSASRWNTGNIYKTLLSIIESPATPTRLKTIKSPSAGSQVVFWSRTGMLLSAYGDRITFFDEHFNESGSKHMSPTKRNEPLYGSRYGVQTPKQSIFQNVMSLTEVSGLQQEPEYIAWTYESSAPVDINGSSTHKEITFNAWLKRYSSQFKESSTLEKYNYTHSSDRHTVTSQNFIRRVVVNPVRSHILAVHDSKLDVLSMDGDLLYTINDYNLSKVKGMIALNDFTLLILNYRCIYNYRYQAPPLRSEQVWESHLPDCYGMSIDAAGCIYVGCEGGIRILSPAGETLKTLDHQLLRSVKILDVCVSKSGDKIAVACGEDGLKLFSLSHEEMK